MSPLFGPDPAKILDRGAPASGRIVGIRVRWTKDDSPVRLDEYAVDVQGSVHGVRQRLHPDMDVRLGQPVAVRVDQKAVVIDLNEVDLFKWKSLKTPPPSGIDDDSDGLGKARARWASATATIERLDERKILMGMGRVVDATAVVEIPGEEAYELTIEKVQPVFYASHLFAAGVTVPVWVDPGRPDKAKIDWAQAAMDDPGVGRPPAWGTDADAPGRLIGISLGGQGGAGPAGDQAAPASPVLQPDGFAARMLARAGVAVDGDPTTVDDPVSWEAFVAVQQAVAAAGWDVSEERQEQMARHQGIAAGEWPQARTRWMQRIGRDLGMSQAYRRAMGG